MIALVDYGAGNLRSVRKALETIGAEVQPVTHPSHLDGVQKIILPGVGAFGDGMAALRAAGLVEPLQAAARSGVPILGICLGMQFLFDESEEMGRHEGLGLLPGRVIRFPADGPKVPHIGWNDIQPVRSHPLLEGLPPGAYGYFVHSYYCLPDDDSVVLTTTEYGLRFPSIVGRERAVGIQFHPEKSQRTGLLLLRNFVERL